MTDYTLNDALMAAFAAFEGTSNDKQMQFFLATFPGSEGATLDDYWLQYCELNGFVEGSTQDRKYAFMKAALGGAEGAYNDIQRQFWISTIPP